MSTKQEQKRLAKSARKAAEKCERAGNKGNAVFFRRLAEAHEQVAGEAAR